MGCCSGSSSTKVHKSIHSRPTKNSANVNNKSTSANMNGTTKAPAQSGKILNNIGN